MQNNSADVLQSLCAVRSLILPLKTWRFLCSSPLHLGKKEGSRSDPSATAQNTHRGRVGPWCGERFPFSALAWILFSFSFYFFSFPEIAAVVGILRSKSQKAKRSTSTDHIQTERHCLLFFRVFKILFCLMEHFDMAVFFSVSQGKQTLKYQILSHNGLSFL